MRDHYEKLWFRRPIVDRATYIEAQDEDLSA